MFDAVFVLLILGLGIVGLRATKSGRRDWLKAIGLTLLIMAACLAIGYIGAKTGLIPVMDDSPEARALRSRHR